jgi:hypothetical protein
MGIVINLTTGAVHIPSVNGLSIEIIRDASDELTIIFSGLNISSGQAFTGHVNRVTGDMMATDSRRDWKTGSRAARVGPLHEGAVQFDQHAEAFGCGTFQKLFRAEGEGD